ncbi:MAG TPA: DUF5134 domain-containing protein [Acidimicrobiales bacterium]|jgi:hypothetical protein|nr:DUF5134 domain-containing protein [Acidimicrobiales bacterium]
MSTPSWLYYLFGVVMLTVAAYASTLLILGVVTDRPAGRDVEISHLFMGVAMAGMFVGAWSFGRSAVWEIIFSLLMIWFLVATVQSVQRYGLHLPHASIHALMNFTMLLMYWFPMGASPSGSMSMSAASSEGRLDPGLASLLALILCASAVFTLASPVKGRTHFGSHAPAYAVSGSVGRQSRSGFSDGVVTPVIALEEAVATPWLVDVSHVVMCVGMAFMLVLMT